MAPGSDVGYHTVLGQVDVGGRQTDTGPCTDIQNPMDLLHVDRSKVQFVPDAKHHHMMGEIKAILLGLSRETNARQLANSLARSKTTNLVVGHRVCYEDI